MHAAPPAPSDPAPAADSPDAAARERARTRRVIIASGTLTIVVMAAVIVFGWRGRQGAPEDLPAGGEHAAAGRPAWAEGTSPLPASDDGCPTDSDRPPQMVFDLPPSGLHFGSVRQGLVLERDVVFRNEGSGTLCIRRVDSGCGCIKARLAGEKREYEPGEDGRIHVVLDTKGREGEEKKTITIYTNAVDVPLKRFVVRASVNLGLRVSPGSLRFGKVTAGQATEGHLKLRAPLDDGRWEVTSLQGTRPLDGKPVAYEWEAKEIPDARDRVLDLRVRHPPVTNTGPVFNDTLVIRTTHPGRPELTVKTSIAVVDEILATPRRAVLGYVPNDIPARVYLRRGGSGVEFEVTGLSFQRSDGAPLDDGASGFVATHGRDGDGETWVEIRYDGWEDRAPGPLRAVLVVHTNLDRMPEVRIDCFATVKDP